MLAIRFATNLRFMTCAAEALELAPMDAPRLLIVDDDPGIRELTTAFLAGHGYGVDAVANGAAMREAMARDQYALIVLDVMMPGEDGLSILRSLDRATSPAVIIMSVIGEEIDRIVGLEMGADDYIAKPASSCWRGSDRCCVGRASGRHQRSPASPADIGASPDGGLIRRAGSCSTPKMSRSTCPLSSSAS